MSEFNEGMNEGRIGRISATRTNIMDMVEMRRRTARILAPGLMNDPMFVPGVVYERVQHHPEQFAGIFHDEQLTGFIEYRDWQWGHQKPFETETNGVAVGGETLPARNAPDTERLSGNPLGIIALDALTMRSQEVGGVEEVLGLLVDHVIEQGDGREIRFPLIETSEGAYDPNRVIAIDRGFNPTHKMGSYGITGYHLFVRPITPVDDRI